MKTLFFDCTNGISGDMVLKALMDLSGQKKEIEEAIKNEHLHIHDHHDHDYSPASHGEHGHCDHEHDHHHSHGRSWLKVRDLINHSSFSDKAKETALNIYQNIAEAEAKVHGETLETIHFHEVGRDEAIKNALGIGMALEAIRVRGREDDHDAVHHNAGQHYDHDTNQSMEILTSPIYDGQGTVICSHGEIPVPVPAVMALRAKCTYTFETADVNMEMVTPSGLASLMGIGAKPVSIEVGDECVSTKTAADICSALSEAWGAQVTIAAQAEAKGSRNTGRDGLRVYLLDRRIR